MKSDEAVVDVIHSPWCFIEAPEESYKEKLEEKWKIKIRESNMWEIEDDTLDSLPKHISKTIRELRDPSNLGMAWYAGGSIFFLNGERLDLSPALKWPQVEKILEARSRKRKP
ncbi:MAG: hypothetical protein OEZ48_11785 [Candidatus Bathyarchaeota archaeon]|nr:hypothetical protein [Candidatus Bathyarchaeota archaeon]